MSTSTVKEIGTDLEGEIIGFFAGLDARAKVAVRLAEEIELLSGGTGSGLHEKIEDAMGTIDVKGDPTLLRMAAAADAIELAMLLR